jgi:hypothetical protein
MGAEGGACVTSNEGEPTEHMGRESGPLEDENPQPEDNRKPRAEPEIEESPNQSPREQSRAPRNILNQDAG